MTTAPRNGLDILSPNALGISCPSCNGPVQDVGIQSGVCPLTGDPASYVLYYCENNANVAQPGPDLDPEALCYGGITVYDTGCISIGDPDSGQTELRDCRDMLTETEP